MADALFGLVAHPLARSAPVGWSDRVCQSRVGSVRQWEHGPVELVLGVSGAGDAAKCGNEHSGAGPWSRWRHVPGRHCSGGAKPSMMICASWSEKKNSPSRSSSRRRASKLSTKLFVHGLRAT